MNAKQTIEAAARGDGCLGHATPDEPVFVLRAHDKHAPLLIQIWAMLVDNEAGVATAIAARARYDASDMSTWQAVNGCKQPD